MIETAFSSFDGKYGFNFIGAGNNIGIMKLMPPQSCADSEKWIRSIDHDFTVTMPLRFSVHL